jgi:hypothetical protein
MKITIALRLTVAIVTAGLVAPAFANTMSVPSEESPAYTVDIPSEWNPKVSKEEETLEATEPDNHVYVTGWVVTKSDIGELKKDIAGLLKDSLKSIEGETKEEAIENNGVSFTVIRGNGIDKREGGKVKFFVAIFPAGSDKAGIFYADWDADAPADSTQKLNNLMNSIKVKA